MPFIGLIVLITLVLVQHSVTAQHIYCNDKHLTTNYTQGNVRISEPYDRFGLPPEVQTCTDQRITLICCMQDFTSILWYQQLNDEWVAFLDAGINRELGERNQTAILTYPYLNRDPGNYKCEGYGEAGPISHVTKLDVHDCVAPQLPAPFYPPDPLVVLHRRLGEYLVIPCQGFYGDVRKCPVPAECNIGWYQLTPGQQRRDVTNDTTQRIYVSPAEKTLDDNGLECTLYITSVTDADYESQFVCWMSNAIGKQDPARTVKFKQTAVHVLSDPLYQLLTALGVCLLAVIVATPLIVWRCGLAIKRYIKDKNRKPLSAEDLKYDVLLMSGETSDRNSLSYYLCHKLRCNSSYKYTVCHFPEDIHSEHLIHDMFFEELNHSRCVVCVVSAGFLRDEHCLFCLDAAIDDVTAVFVLQPDDTLTSLDDVAQAPQLTDKVKQALKVTRNKLVWPVASSTSQRDVECDGGMSRWKEVEKLHGKQVEKFWNQLRLAIPRSRCFRNT